MDFVIFDQLHALRSESFDGTTQQVVATVYDSNFIWPSHKTN